MEYTKKRVRALLWLLVYLIGFGFDGTACFRKGTKDGPDAIREVAYGIESYSPYLDADLENVTFYDCGNLSLGDSSDVDQQWAFASEQITQMLDNTDPDFWHTTSSDGVIF